MSIEKAKAHLAAYGMADKVIEFPVSSATVELAAKALGCEPAHIAKSIQKMYSLGVNIEEVATDFDVDVEFVKGIVKTPSTGAGNDEC